MSSQNICGRAFPIACERCGRRAATPVFDGTYVKEDRLQIAVRCGLCGHGWLACEPNAPFKAQRKTDRRAVSRRN